ncbi:uncharacterized protein LOC129592924 [Paramacrobiotus metropolitanus]|uniref:uncharacterized protein LOC129592924 n=1 Tax=Paramacrobiotus metropolitanus TaxID=2943436 RepID=UPI0024462C6D|nr:uncharacterized protein LOC129592924 [Paramacrobiotus metropolitanus]
MMERVQGVRNRLDKKSAWAYQEIMAEAMFVLWLASQVAVRLGYRFLPEWQDDRVDRNGENVFGPEPLLWIARLINISGCLWDHVALPWTEPGTITTQGVNASHTISTVTVPVNFGYLGTFLIVSAAIFLAVSVMCSLIVNRHWNLIPLSRHLRFCHQHTPRSLSILNVLPFIFLGVMFAAGLLVFEFLWLVVGMLPLVMLAGGVAMAIISACGVQAVLPCCAVMLPLLAMYSAGRIWGLWLNVTYLQWITQKLRVSLVRQHPGAKEDPEDQTEVVSTPAGNCSQPRQQIEFRSLILISSTVIFTTSVLKLFAGFPGNREWDSTGRVVDYGTGCPNTAADTGFGRITAILSYWVELDYSRHGNMHDGIHARLSPFSWFFGFVWLVWSGSLLAVVLLGPILLTIATILGPFVRCCIAGSHWVGLKLYWLITVAPEPDEEEDNAETRRDGSKKTVGVDTVVPRNHVSCDGCRVCSEWIKVNDDSVDATVTDPYELRDRPMDCPLCGVVREPTAFIGRRCTCELAGIFGAGFVYLKEAFVWLFLPFPVTELVLAERLQVAGILLLWSVACMWVQWRFLESLLDKRRHDKAEHDKEKAATKRFFDWTDALKLEEEHVTK